MKRFLTIFIFFILVLRLTPVFAQEDVPMDAVLDNQMESAARGIKSGARKALEENRQLKVQNEILRNQEFELQNQIDSLTEESVSIKSVIIHDQHIMKGIEERTKKIEKYFAGAQARLKVLAPELEGLRKKLAGVKEQKSKLQKELDSLQAQKQSLVSFEESLKKKEFPDGVEPILQTMEASQQKLAKIKIEREKFAKELTLSEKTLALIMKEPFVSREEDQKRLDVLKILVDGQGLGGGAGLSGENKISSSLQGQKSLERQKVQAQALIKQLERFSLSLVSKVDHLGGFSSGREKYVSLIKEKNDKLIEEIAILGQEGFWEDFKSLEKEAAILGKLADQETKANQRLKKKLVDLQASNQKKLREIDRLKKDIEKLSAKDAEQKKVLEQKVASQESVPPEPASLELVQGLPEQALESKEIETLSELRKQKKRVALESQLQVKINNVDTENKILNNRLAELNEKIIKVEEEKSLLEDLLKQQHQGSPAVKVDNDVRSAPSSEATRPARALWKIPDILKD